MTLPGRRRGGADGPPAASDGPFVEVLLSHLDAVHRMARHLAPAGASAEDLVQETYARALASPGRQELRDPRAWLLTICLNIVRNEARRQARHPEDLLDPGALSEVAGASREAGGRHAGVAVEHDPGQLAELAEHRRAIAAALTELPEPQRAAIVLVDVVGCTAREAAELLACPRGTVLARVHRGRRRLAVLLATEGAGDGV